jgi:hypothetical protein
MSCVGMMLRVAYDEDLVSGVLVRVHPAQRPPTNSYAAGGPMPIASSADTVLSILLLAILVLGYVVLWAIWHFFFRARDHEHRGDDRR